MKKLIELSDRLFDLLTSASPEKKFEQTARMADGDPELGKLLEQLDDKDWISSEINKMDRFDTDRAWDAVAGRAGIARRHGLLFLNRRFISAAASVAVIVLAAALWFTRGSSDSLNETLLTPELSLAIDESEQKGITGAVVENVSIEKKTRVNPSRRRQPESTAQAEPRKSFTEEIKEAKRVTTFYNKEYWLTLPDGTVVHLARDTRFMFPERFAADCREVYLEGEAYFIVAKNPRSRFIIHTDAGNATVYGTELNVKSRTPGICEVVLVTGKAGVTPDGNGAERMLVPGEEAVVSGSEISVREVDLAPYKAWNTGRVDFDSWPLSRVLSVIGRWYGKTVTFVGEGTADITISGNFDRYEDLMPTLESISAITGTSITVTDDCITVADR